jgi:hypothetical protein
LKRHREDAVEKRGEHELKGVADLWHIYAVARERG